MNIVRSIRFLVVLSITSAWLLAPSLRADDPAPAANAAPSDAAAPAQQETNPPAPAAVTVPPAEAAKADAVAPAPAAVLAPAVETPATVPTENAAPAATPAETASQPAPEPPHRGRHHNGGGSPRLGILSSSTLEEGQEADAVVSILGSSTSAGTVHDAVVSVVGNTRVTAGSVGDAAVSVLGSTYVNAEVRGQVVAVLGDVDLGPKAVVHGEIVCVGGHVNRDPAAVVHGGVQNVALGGRDMSFSGLAVYFQQCTLKARLLAFRPDLWWAWCVALGFLGFYLLLALVAPRGMVKCAETFEQRPGSSILAAILTLMLTPVAYILLLITLAIAVGFVLLPAFSLGLFIATIFGKAVMLAWLGRRITNLAGDGPWRHPFFSVAIGGVIVLLLYTVPIVGFVVFKSLGFLGLGVVVYTLILHSRNSRPPRPAPVRPTVVPAVAVAAAASVAAVSATSGAVPAPSAPVAPMPSMEPPPVAAVLPPVISAATLPRVGFWLRLAASVLDAILIGIMCGFLSTFWHRFGNAYVFWYALYCVLMWKTKGTTIGGIICGLKLVRLDDRPIEWGVAIVRALGGFLSLAVAGLGFVWVSFDDERQSWHDKIAGTTIVRVPKGTSLM